MNTYIQDKLLEKHICRFNDGECNCDCYIAGMTDYHNHIVEILEKERQTWAKESIGEIAVKSIIDRLQDTNPKE